MEPFDKLLKETLTEYERESINVRDAKAQEEFTGFSPEFEARMDKLLSGKPIHRRRKGKKYLWKAAVAAAGFLLVISSFRPVQEVYAGMAESVVQVYEQFTRIAENDRAGSSYEAMADPTYIPEGYVKEEGKCIEGKKFKKLVYVNEKQEQFEIEYLLQNESPIFQADDEIHDFMQIKIDNIYEGMYFETEGENASNMLLWNNGNTWYCIDGKEVREELTKIAESIMKKR